ncbi:MAG: hypothetical protein R2765_10825 [Ferruginibacter sp.]
MPGMRFKKGNSFLIESFSDKEKQELFTHLFNYEPWKNLSTGRKKELLSRKGGFARSIVISQHTSISITNHNGKAFTDEENKILKRFGKVFEQTYIRFLIFKKPKRRQVKHKGSGSGRESGPFRWPCTIRMKYMKWFVHFAMNYSG